MLITYDLALRTCQTGLTAAVLMCKPPDKRCRGCATMSRETSEKAVCEKMLYRWRRRTNAHAISAIIRYLVKNR